MKRNTGCGSSNSMKKCPPMQACDTAKTHGDFCTVGNPTNTGSTERTAILADVPITTNVEADIYLPSSAQEIKAIRKNVYLTQCKAIPVPPTTGTTTTAVNLYIEGYVHKNIQYSEGCDGYIRDYSVNVPFKCFHPVTGLANINFATSQKSNQIQEIRDLAPDGHGADRCSFGSITFENYNEPIECKLLTSRVVQMDFPHDFDRWGNFEQITEKMTIDFVVRLTQLQRQ
ncbi:CsxC family protein [Falsibacillus pallidus]|uniref:CsxC family protein n=1 Tax=Falsibacillus pallidus TaxID=493781 RepID=UPI003D9664BE